MTGRRRPSERLLRADSTVPYKSVAMRPYAAQIKRGRGKTTRYEDVPVEEVLDALAQDAESLSALVEWQIHSEIDIRDKVKAFVDDHSGLSLAKVGEYMGYRLPSEVLPDPAGKSRYERMFQGRVISEVLSWHKRSEASTGESEGFVSAGWARTASDIAPTDLIPKMSLSFTDERYYAMSGDPLNTGNLVLDLVVSGAWHRLRFRFDTERFSEAKKVCAPDIVSKNGRVTFHFAVEYEYIYAGISSEYRIGVDVGKVHPATVTVVNRQGEIVHSTTLSQRVASLANSIRATERQVRNLHKKGRLSEAALHRSANVGKKREMALLIGQEVADIQHAWGNAVVAVENLSWISNTMQNGRWNRGEVVKWITHFCSLNGGLVYTRNAAWTSQVCHKCGEKGRLRDRDFICANQDCLWAGVCQDRDVNAGANIALRVKLDTVDKTVTTRTEKRKKRGQSSNQKRRTPQTRQSLKYPGRDRTKSGPTPKRPKKRLKSMREVNDVSGTSEATRPTVPLDEIGEVSRSRDSDQLPDYELEQYCSQKLIV